MKEGEEDDDDEEDANATPSKPASAGAETKEDERAMEGTTDRGSEDELLDLLHTLLLDTHVTEGELQCGGCHRRYAIQQGIPNMRLNEDEV